MRFWPTLSMSCNGTTFNAQCTLLRVTHTHAHKHTITHTHTHTHTHRKAAAVHIIAVP